MSFGSFLTRRQLLWGAVCSSILYPLSARDAFARMVYEPNAVPVQLPAVEFKDAHGRTKSLLDFRGRVILLAYWQTYCGVCVRELPSLNKMRADLSNGWFQVVPVAGRRSGDAQTIRKFLSDHKVMSLPIYTDDTGAVDKLFDIEGVPFHALIDHEGRELGRFRGGVNWQSREVRSVLQRAVRAAGGRLRELD